MSKGRPITKEVRNKVERLWYNHPSYTAAKIREKANYGKNRNYE